MANIFLSQALQAAGKPIVSAIAQKSYEQQKFKQIQNALLAEFQELEARELNLLATQKRMENASEQLPENLNKLNALVAMSATGQVDPNTVGKAAAELALTNKALGTTKNALSAELQDIQSKKQFLQTQPALRAIMSGDVKTEAGLAGISAVQYPVAEPKKYKFQSFTVGDKDILARTTESGEFYVIDSGMKESDKNTFGASDRLSVARLQRDVVNDAYERAATGAYRIFPKEVRPEAITTLLWATRDIQDKDERIDYISDYLKDIIKADEKERRSIAKRFDYYVETSVPKHIKTYIENSGGDLKEFLMPLLYVAEEKLASIEGDKKANAEVWDNIIYKFGFTNPISNKENTYIPNVSKKKEEETGSSLTFGTIGG